MHGKLLIITGFTLSGGTVAAALHPDARSLWSRVRAIPARVEAPRPPAPPAGIEATRAAVPPVAPVQAPVHRGDGLLPRLRAPDGRVINLPWRRGARDSAEAAWGRDSMAALLAPGQRQLACDLENQPRYVRTLSLLVMDSALIQLRLLRARSGLRWGIQPAGYLLEMEAEPLSQRRVRELCDAPIGELQ